MSHFGKVCLVTGASRGIGRCIAINLSRRGALVAVNYHVNEAAANETLSLLQPPQQQHAQHGIFKANVSSPEECEMLVRSVVAQYGRLDVIVNNAGVCFDHDVMSVTYAEWQSSLQQTMDANFFGAANLSYLAIRQFLAQRKKKEEEGGGAGVVAESGRIVNITSRAAYRGELTAAGYAASKSALSILGQSLARRYAGDGVYVFTVAPGWVETEMAREVVHGPQAAEVLAQHPLGRIAHPDEVGKEVAYLAMDAPAAMTGCVIDLNGASYLR